MKAEFKWNSGAKEKWDGQFSRAQKFLDNEVLRTTAPYVPHVTGTLERSGQLGTVIGSGEVVYNAPYAAAQYYNTAESRDYDPQRGGMWFERSKADHKGEWLRGTKKIAGGG
nr:MAG TPA: Minor capsid protein [Caudoviricetes sp.]